MRAARYHEHGGPEVLGVEEVERPDPGPGEVLVRVRAASVNPVDTKFREGAFGDVSLPGIPGGDGAGVVAAVGPGVEAVDVDDRVCFGGVGQSDTGTFAEFVAVPVTKVARLPDGVPFEVGGALPNAGATAWTALVDLADLRPTERCLVHGGSGGVGHVAVQLARVVGADAVATAGTATARERVRQLGAVAALDYDSDSLTDEVVAATDGAGVDVVLDHRLDDYLELDLAVATQGARVVTITGDVPATGGAPLRNKEITVRGMSMGNRPERGPILRKLVALLADGDLVVDVAATYDLDDEGVRQAHRDVLAGGYVGKLVVTP